MKMTCPLMITTILLASLAGCSLLPSRNSMPTPTPTHPPIPASSYEPQPDDAELQRGQVFLDLKNSPLVISESLPVQVSLILNGNLPDPCHKLRVVVVPANPQREVRLEVYSVYDPQLVCITVLQPINATIPLGSFPSGHYTVFVNDQLVGEFDG